MSKATETSHREHWLACARRVSRTVNLGWWLEMLAAPLLVAALIGAAALLVVRREQPALEPWVVPSAIGGAVVLTALVCWWLAARKFEKPDDSLVRIEASMRLRNALSAAKAGVAPWPAPVGKIDAGISWQWPRLIVPPLGALVLLAAGWFIPVSAKTTTSGPPEQPQAWKQLDSELDHLTQEQVVDEKYLEDTRKRLEELKSQEEEQWFSHSSLEATDSLKKSHRAESERVERELGKADKALENLEKNAGASQAAKNKMMEDFDQALQGLQKGAMKPNPQLLEQMKGLDMKNMANLTPEQLQQLRENLKKNADAMKGAKGEGQGGDDWSDELLGDGEGEGKGNGNGEGEGEGEGKDGEGAGKGGINRGPGHDPNVLGKEKDGLDTGALTGLEAKDLSNSSPGDLLELQDGEHDVDKSATRLSQGGNTDATGRGGDRVWKDSLDPSEQRALKKFFE